MLLKTRDYRNWLLGKFLHKSFEADQEVYVRSCIYSFRILCGVNLLPGALILTRVKHSLLCVAIPVCMMCIKPSSG